MRRSVVTRNFLKNNLIATLSSVIADAPPPDPARQRQDHARKSPVAGGQRRQGSNQPPPFVRVCGRTGVAVIRGTRLRRLWSLSSAEPWPGIRACGPRRSDTSSPTAPHRRRTAAPSRCCWRARTARYFLFCSLLCSEEPPPLLAVTPATHGKVPLGNFALSGCVRTSQPVPPE
jgi:hypothetical protein